MLQLLSVQESAQRIAKIIHETLRADVSIVDTQFRAVAHSEGHPHAHFDGTDTAVTGRVMRTGEVIATDDKSTFDLCRQCRKYETCDVRGVIGVPVKRDGQVLGAIVAQFSAGAAGGEYGALNRRVSFMQEMAELLADVAAEKQKSAEVVGQVRAREQAIDIAGDGVVLTDAAGVITYYNDKFRKYFLVEEEVLGCRLVEVLPNSRIIRFFEQGREMNHRLLYIPGKHGVFDGFCCARHIDGGAVFTFRSISDDIVPVVTDTHPNYNRLETFLGSSPRMKKAQRKSREAAKNDDILLIEGVHGTRKRELAHAIHNASARSQGNFFVVECNVNSDDHLEAEIFGMDDGDNMFMSKLRLANTGTLCLCSVDKMSRYLQGMLLDFIENGKVAVANDLMIKSNARLILVSSSDLGEAVKLGAFDETLYKRLIKNRIYLPPIGESAEDIHDQLEFNFAFYANRKGITEIEVDPAVVEKLKTYSWPGDVRELKMVCEHLINHSDNGKIGPELLETIPLNFDNSFKNKSVNDLLEEEITRMIATGKNRDEIASALKISRATLYRKLKKFNEKPKQQ